MANRPFHELAERISSERLRILQTFGMLPDTGACERSTKDLLIQISVLLKGVDPSTISDIQTLADDLISPERIDRNNPGYEWRITVDKMHTQYSKLHDAYTQIMDMENSVHRSERRSQIRAVFFRIVTTLGVGLSIMFIYWLADYWGLSMPLSRKM